MSNEMTADLKEKLSQQSDAFNIDEKLMLSNTMDAWIVSKPPNFLANAEWIKYNIRNVQIVSHFLILDNLLIFSLKRRKFSPLVEVLEFLAKKPINELGPIKRGYENCFTLWEKFMHKDFNQVWDSLIAEHVAQKLKG